MGTKEPFAYYDHFNDHVYFGDNAKEQADKAEAGDNPITPLYKAAPPSGLEAELRVLPETLRNEAVSVSNQTSDGWIRARGLNYAADKLEALLDSRPTNPEPISSNLVDELRGLAGRLAAFLTPNTDEEARTPLHEVAEAAAAWLEAELEALLDAMPSETKP